MDLALNILRVILLLCSFIGYIYFFKKKFGWETQTLPFFVMPLIISTLYIFALIGFLEPAAFLIFIIGLFLFICKLVECIKSRSNLTYPGTAIIIFVLIYIGLWLHFRDALYVENDEFSHWGLAVKEMFLKNRLADANSSLIFPDYPPGVTLFLYYVSKIVGYSEGVTYFAQNLLALSGMMVLIYDDSWKKITQTVFSLTVGSFLLIIYNFLLSTLYVDAILGIMFGGVLVSYFSSENRDKNSVFFLIPVLLFIPLIKQIGAFLGAVLVFIIFIDQIILRKRLNTGIFSKDLPWRKAIFYSLVFLLPFVSTQTWNFYTSCKGTNKSFNIPISYKQVTESFSSDTVTNRDIETISAFKKAPGDRFFFSKLNLYRILALFTLTAFMALFLTQEKHFKMTLVWTNIVLLSGFIVYATVHLILYLYAFSEYEGLRLAGFQRYMSIYLLGWGLFLLGTLRVHKLNPFYLALVVSVFLTGNSVLGITRGHYKYLFRPTDISLRLAVKESIPDYVNQKLSQNPGKVWIIWQNTTGLEFRMARFEIAPVYTNSLYWNLGKPYYEGDVWAIRLSPQVWAKKLKEYDYVLILHGDYQFWKLYSDLFTKQGNIGHKFFRVLKDKQELAILEAI